MFFHSKKVYHKHTLSQVKNFFLANALVSVIIISFSASVLLSCALCSTLSVLYAKSNSRVVVFTILSSARLRQHVYCSCLLYVRFCAA